MAGILYIVPTPIGNLEDITMRALRILKEADFIAAEDTRHSRKLLTHFDIHPSSLFSYHEHNVQSAGQRIIEELQQGRTGALISDAGMPAVSDPGHDIVVQLLEAKLPFVTLPGPSAFVTALVASGLTTNEFSFYGFLPRDKKSRRSRLAALRFRTETLIFYEAPHRLASMMADLFPAFGERRVTIARELTKIHESFYRGYLSEWSTLLEQIDLRGEIVVLVEGCPIAVAQEALQAPLSQELDRTPESLQVAVAQKVLEGVPRNEALRLVAKLVGLSRRDVYQQLLTLSSDSPEE